MFARWYFKIAEAERGPVTTDELRSLVVSGELSDADLVRSQNGDTWQRVDSIDDGFDHAARMAGLGVSVGRELRIVRVGEPTVVQVYGSRIGIAREIARCIRVVPAADVTPDGIEGDHIWGVLDPATGLGWAGNYVGDGVATTPASTSAPWTAW